MTVPVLSESRARALRRLMLLTVAFGVVLVVGAVPLAVNDYAVYAAVVGVVGLVYIGSAALTLRSLPARDVGARRLGILTGVLLLLLSVPLITIWVGLLTAVAGVGVLFVLSAPDREGA